MFKAFILKSVIVMISKYCKDVLNVVLWYRQKTEACLKHAEVALLFYSVIFEVFDENIIN